MKALKLFVASVGLGTMALSSCTVDTAPEGLRRTPPGNGPKVVWNPSHRPLPEVPLPNDYGTFADPTSRTGRRINVSLVAPAHMEQHARRSFQELEGWGTSAPISVKFERAEGADPREAAIDLDDVKQRFHDDYDFSNDPVYVVNLRTGVPAVLEVGQGNFPVNLRDPHKYFPNDPKAAENNLLFETQEEGPGLTQADYRPELDMDFDGVLDHPNVLGRGKIPTVDDLLTWYERETDTLILRPLLPLEEKTEYAVVLTDRLRGPNGEPVKSPFPYIHHPQQKASLGALAGILNDQKRAAYFGDIAGSGLEHVAFAWTFTTMPVQEDMKLLRDGLYGKGPFSRFATEYPPDMNAFWAAGPGNTKEDNPPGWENSNDKCRKRARTPYSVSLQDPDVQASFRKFFTEILKMDPGDVEALMDGFKYISHLVIGSFKTPYLLGDPATRDEDTQFHLNFKDGSGDVRPDDVTFILAVPKEAPGMKQPFPVVLHGHGVTSEKTEALVYAGDFARQGLATLTVENPEHGTVLKEADELIARAELTANCVVPWVKALKTSRAHDLNGDGVGDSGWFWWTSHLFHTRDNVRQGIFETMQAVRILRAFDGKRPSNQDYNGNGDDKDDLAGDFDGNGVPDVGGPSVKYFVSGESLGGIMSAFQGGVEPYFYGSAPMSGGGVLVDVGFKSYGVVEAVMGQIFTPMFFSVPAEERTYKEVKDNDEQRSKPQTACAPGQRSVRLLVNEGDLMQEMEVACLAPEELSLGMTVVATNVTNGERRCARTSMDGRFRVPIPASVGDKLDIQLYSKPDVVVSYKGCDLKPGVGPELVGRRINTWEQALKSYRKVADGEKTKCEAEEGCQQFRDVFYAKGSPLVAPQEGFGIQRQTPEMRRLRDLAMIAVEGMDPINFAPYYMLKPLYDENGREAPPHALLYTNTVGDQFVPVSSGTAFARAAGAIPFFPPSALTRFPEYADYVTPQAIYDLLGGKTPNQYLIETDMVEAIARFGRSGGAGPNCKANFDPKAHPVCENLKRGDPSPSTCQNALFDIDWVSEGRMRHDQPHPKVPLRIARLANMRLAGREGLDQQTLARAWEPRLRGIPFAPDATAWQPTEPLVGFLNMYLELGGKHTWDAGDVCKAWDYATYGNNLFSRFFATEGKDIYYLSHPSSHQCLEDSSCPFFVK
jgi:hypothetical protein